MTIIDAIEDVLSESQPYRYRIGRSGQQADFTVAQPITMSPEDIIADDWIVRLA